MAETLVRETVLDKIFETTNMHLYVAGIGEYEEIKGAYSKSIQETMGVPCLTRDELFEIRKKALQRKRYVLTVRENTKRALLGCAEIKRVDENTVRLSFWIAEQYWSKGYGTELYKKLLELAHFWFPHTHILFEIDRDSIPATRIAEQHSGEYTSFRIYEVTHNNGKKAVQRPKRYLVHAL